MVPAVLYLKDPHTEHKLRHTSLSKAKKRHLSRDDQTRIRALNKGYGYNPSKSKLFLLSSQAPKGRTGIQTRTKTLKWQDLVALLVLFADVTADRSQFAGLRKNFSFSFSDG